MQTSPEKPRIVLRRNQFTKYDFDDVDKLQVKFNLIRSRMDELAEELDERCEAREEFERLQHKAAKVLYEIHETLIAIEFLLNADGCGGVH